MRQYLGNGLIVVVALLSPRFVLADDFMSSVSVTNTTQTGKDSGDNANDMDPAALIAYVNTPVKAQIKYKIGFSRCPSEGGSCTLVRSEITDPEYTFQGYQGNYSTPPGINFNSDSGELSGTPTTPGIWKMRPAVRDKIKGDDTYRGNGYWWTWTNTIDGKKFYASKSILKIIVLNRPTGDKDVALTCDRQSGSLEATRLLNLDLENGYVFTLKTSGEPDYVAKIDPDSTLIGWTRYGFNESIDRTTGLLRLTGPGGMDGTWKCAKRSTKKMF